MKWTTVLKETVQFMAIHNFNESKQGFSLKTTGQLSTVATQDMGHSIWTQLLYCNFHVLFYIWMTFCVTAINSMYSKAQNPYIDCRAGKFLFIKNWQFEDVLLFWSMKGQKRWKQKYILLFEWF